MKTKNRTVLADSVYDYIKNLIYTKKIRCGERINEQKIEKELNVSRTPVREAVRRLSNEGIVTLVPNRFTEVITFTKESIQELGMVRISMDCLAAQLAIENGSNKDFDSLTELSQKCYEAYQEKNWYDQIEYDCEFHLRLIQMSNNNILFNLQKNIILKSRLLQTDRFDETFQSSFPCDLEQHKKILEGLYERNVEKVLNAIKQHLAPFYLLEDEQIRIICLS